MAANIGESRSDLLQWLNNLLDLNYTKVEQCGTGAAYCQIIDSIYNDVAMNKVKFTVQYDYEFLGNYKVLQSSFAKHNITKAVPVERLSKCKMQDNLEFLQWIKRFWSEQKDETPYDPNARRKMKVVPGSRTGSSMNARNPSSMNSRTGNRAPSSTSTRASSASRTRPAAASASASATTTTTMRTAPTTRTTTTARMASSSTRQSIAPSVKPRAGFSAQNNKIQKELENELTTAKSQIGELTEELNEYRSAAEGLETERNFYFNKLRDIEILSQSITDQLSEEAETQHQQQLQGTFTSDILKNNQTLIEFVEKIQDILYSTEEGFSVPNSDAELEDQEISDAEDDGF